jgi:GNAT superfamily N-acetyltransferase
MAALHIRPATKADALAIATVHVRSWQAAYRGLLPQDHLDGLDPDQSRVQWESTLEATAWPSTGTLVLVDEDISPVAATETIIGFAGLGPTRDHDDDPTSVGELQTLYLDPGAWHQGAGSRLLSVAQVQLGRAGFTIASAWVLETNVRARTFYEHHGWRFDGATKLHDWGTFVVTDVRYRRPLVSPGFVV